MAHLEGWQQARIWLALTLGLVLPANPALSVEVPLSITTGWLSNKELPVSSAAVVSSALMVFVTPNFSVGLVSKSCSGRHRKQREATQRLMSREGLLLKLESQLTKPKLGSKRADLRLWGI